MSHLNVRSSLRVNSHANGNDLPGQYPAPTSPLTPNTSTQLSLGQALHARRSEYTKPRSTRIKVGSWNVAAHKSTNRDLGEWFVKGKGISDHLTTVSTTDEDDGQRSTARMEGVGEQEARHKKKRPTVPKDDPGLEASSEDIGIYALGLQEIVDINSISEALRPFSDTATSARFKKSMENSLPKGYQLVAEQQLIGLLLLIYASPEIAPQVHCVSTTSVGTGLGGYMGNKGAVTTRLVVGEMTRLVFVNSHLSAGTGKAELERRHWDVSQVINRTRFDPITDGLGIVQETGERIGDEDHAFWFGDLNFRLEGMPPEDVRKLLMLHVRNEYDVGQQSANKIDQELDSSTADSGATTDSGSGTCNASDINGTQSDAAVKSNSPSDPSDPASLQATINSLLAHDELYQAQKDGKSFPDWKEGPITFLPTYKYDVGSMGVFDSGEKKRGPSWCDRILYRSRKDRIEYAEKQRLASEAKLRDEELKKSGIDAAAEDESTMFEYDPDHDADDDYDENNSVPEVSPTKDQVDNMEDDLVLETYVSHQRVLSADHKPLNAVFKLKFDAAVPELKAKVQQEVARELDRAENEGRPVLTVVIDGTVHADDPNFTGVSFGHIRYDEPKTRSITLANTGRVVSYFGFVSKPQHSETAAESSTTPKWLSINLDIPSERTAEPSKPRQREDDAWDIDVDKVFKLEPGDTCNVQLASYVKDKELLRRFNSGETMEDILVLRVKQGRDHFVPVRGSWQKSVHGRTLDILTRLPEGGIRALQSQRPQASHSHLARDRSPSGVDNDSRQHPVRWSAPREIFRLIESIESLTERVVAEWTMLGSPTGVSAQPPWVVYAGWPFVEESWTLDSDVRQSLRVDLNEALDTDQPLESGFSPALPPLHRLEALVDVFLEFLGNLVDGIVTEELWSKIVESSFPDTKPKVKPSPAEAKAAALEAMSSSQAHSISWILITSMLSRVAQEVCASMIGPLLTSSSQARVSNDLPMSPKVSVRRKTLDQDDIVARRQLANKNIAAVFADVLIRIPNAESWAATEAHRRELVEMFVDSSI